MLDTNVVLDLVVFLDPGAGILRSAIEERRVTPLASPDTLAELERVLAYPAFGLEPPARQSAFGWYERRIELAGTPPAHPHLPRCADAHDQKFLDLAWAAGASHLVTKDKALLVLARRVAKLGRFLVCSPTELDWARE